MCRRSFVAGAAGWSAFGLTNATASADPPLKKIRVGVIGTQHAHAAGKVSTLRLLNHQFELVGVVEPDDAARRKAQQTEEFAGLPWLTEFQLLSIDGLQAVAVETNVKDLVSTAMHCAQVGLHVHLDKPAGESLEDFAALLSAAERHRAHIQLGYMFRYNAAFDLCIRLTRAGILGKVFAVHGEINKNLNADERKRLSRYRGGGMFELGCHLIDVLVTLLGPPATVTPFAHRSDKDSSKIADNQLAVFEYSNAIATIRCCLTDPQGFENRHFVVQGDNGVFEIRPLEPPTVQLTLMKAAGGYKSGQQTLSLPKTRGRYEQQLLDFAALIRTDHATKWTAEHDLATHRAVLAACGIISTPKN